MAMPLPPELAEIPDDTTVIGDVEVFVSDYVENGKAFRDWNDRIAICAKELEEFFE